MTNLDTFTRRSALKLKAIAEAILAAPALSGVSMKAPVMERLPSAREYQALLSIADVGRVRSVCTWSGNKFHITGEFDCFTLPKPLADQMIAAGFITASAWIRSGARAYLKDPEIFADEFTVKQPA